MSVEEVTIGTCRLICGKAEAVIPTLPPFDLVITSPPYNLGSAPWPHLGHWKPGDGAGGKSKWRNGSDACHGTQYQSHPDTMAWPTYVAWQHAILTMLWERLPDQGAIFYNHKPRVVGGRLWTPLELLPPEMILRQIIIWARPGGMNFNPTAFVPTHEWILLLAKPGFRLKSKGVSGFGDVWRMAPDDNLHPAPFPLELPLRILEATHAAHIVDPFAGSFTTGLASTQRRRSFTGCEIDRGYWDLGCRRIASAYAQLDLTQPQTWQAPTQEVLL